MKYRYIVLARVSHSAVEASAFQLRCKGLNTYCSWLVSLSFLGGAFGSWT